MPHFSILWSGIELDDLAVAEEDFLSFVRRETRSGNLPFAEIPFDQMFVAIHVVAFARRFPPSGLDLLGGHAV